jgi:hypothetical protein
MTEREKVRVVVIDAKNRRVYEEFISRPVLPDLQRLAANGGYIDLVRLTPKLDLYVDDEGLINGTKDMFLIHCYAQPLCGNGVIAGHDGEGATISTDVRVEDVAKTVAFISREEFAAILVARGMRS